MIANYFLNSMISVSMCSDIILYSTIKLYCFPIYFMFLSCSICKYFKVFNV